MIVFLNTLFLTQLLLCTFFLFLCMTDINLFWTLCCLHKHGYTVINNLHKTTSDSYLTPVPRLNFHAGNSDIYCNHHILMVWQNSYCTAIIRRYNDLPASSFVKHTVTCNYFQTKCFHMRTPLLF